MVSAARRMVPILIGLMTFAFATYLILKGLNKIWKVGLFPAMTIGTALGLVTYWLLGRSISGKSDTLENNKQSINTLFTIPLICAAALLSFAHGANDVANAIGPLAAIADVLAKGGAELSKSATIPFWVMMVGAIGISLGLWLFGPKVIRTVGSEITELDKMRAFCIAMAATITVIVASQFGLPVSSTHIAVGGVFGVGFLREYLKANYARMEDEIHQHHPENDREAIDEFLARFKKASVDEKGRMLAELKTQAKLRADPAHFSKFERKGLRRVYRQELVKRSQLFKIVAAWVITVPASALIAAMIYYMIRGMFI
jgi:PiT family inorganic phosphate transporter